MKLETAPLQQAMAVAVRMLDRNTVIPEHGLVKIDFETDFTRLSTTNLDRSFSTKIKVFNAETGSVLIDAQRFNTFIQRVEDEFVEFVIKEREVVIKRKKGNASFILSNGNFPVIPVAPDNEPTIITGKALKEMFGAVLCGMQEDKFATKPWMNIADFTVTDNHFQCLSSDEKRIVIVEGECESPNTNIQFPISAIRLLVSVLDDDKVKIIPSEKHLFVESDHLFSFRTISTQFPNMSGVLAWDTVEAFRVETKDLRNSLELVKSLTDPRLQSVRWTLGDDVMFSAQSSGIGNIEESLGVKPSMQLSTGYNINWL